MGLFFFFSSRRRHTRCALVTGVQTCALPICLALDLKKPAAKEALWRLIDGADAIVHNMRPQKMAALGFGPDAVLARQPGIVYGGLHGYREDGPYAERPAYDDVIQGESGFAGAFQERDGAPMLAPTVVADKSAALLASTGLVAALFQRLRTGKGVYVEIAMFESLVGYVLQIGRAAGRGRVCRYG